LAILLRKAKHGWYDAIITEAKNKAAAAKTEEYRGLSPTKSRTNTRAPHQIHDVHRRSCHRPIKTYIDGIIEHIIKFQNNIGISILYWYFATILYPQKIDFKVQILSKKNTHIGNRNRVTCLCETHHETTEYTTHQSYLLKKK
jgi:hypothetical protein